MVQDKRKFSGSVSVRAGETRVRMELSPAPLHGGPEGCYRVRLARRWLDTDDGRLVGLGTHDQLRQSCPVYEEIYESQFKKGDVQK